MRSKHQLTDLLHLLFCQKKHTTNLLDLGKENKGCQYIIEHQLADAWIQPDHLAWLGECDKFLLELGVRDPQIALEILIKIIKISKEFRELLQQHPNIRPYLATLKILPD